MLDSVTQPENLLVGYLVFEVAKYFDRRRFEKKLTSEGSFGDQEKFQLSGIYQAVNSNQKETLVIILEIAQSQKEIAKILERVLTKLDR